jgi:uncharacterized membrane protein
MLLVEMTTPNLAMDYHAKWKPMHKGRLEAFSDGVIAILITIMVLEMKAPHFSDWSALFKKA